MQNLTAYNKINFIVIAITITTNFSAQKSYLLPISDDEKQSTISVILLEHLSDACIHEYVPFDLEPSVMSTYV